MNVDLENAQKEFIKYTENFNTKDKNVKRKQQHSIRVMKIAEQIATNLKLSEEQIQLATLIGLLHDIGRFKQYTDIGLGNNLEGFDHGDYGTKLLFKEGLIRKFIETNKYDEIIKKSIKNHNKFSIEAGLTQEELLFAKLIRDADKIDILYESIDIYYKNNEEEVNKSVLSEKIYNEFTKKATIKKEKNVRLKFIDDITCVIAFIYDINYKTSFEIIKEKDYINKIIDRYNFKDQSTKIKVDEIKKIANEYIKEKIMEEK